MVGLCLQDRLVAQGGAQLDLFHHLPGQGHQGPTLKVGQAKRLVIKHAKRPDWQPVRGDQGGASVEPDRVRRQHKRVVRRAGVRRQV